MCILLLYLWVSFKNISTIGFLTNENPGHKRRAEKKENFKWLTEWGSGIEPSGISTLSGFRTAFVYYARIFYVFYLFSKKRQRRLGVFIKK